MPFYNPLRSKSGGIIQTLGDVSQKHKWEHKERGGGEGGQSLLPHVTGSPAGPVQSSEEQLSRKFPSSECLFIL